jgi:hypothetical protein
MKKLQKQLKSHREAMAMVAQMQPKMMVQSTRCPKSALVLHSH